MPSDGFAFGHGSAVEYVPGRIIIDVPTEEADMVVGLIRLHQEQQRNERLRKALATPMHDLVAEAWAAPSSAEDDGRPEA